MNKDIYVYSKPTSEMLELVAKERKYQDIKWNREPGLYLVDEFEKLAITTEELGEVAKSLLDNESLTELQKELIQVAACAVAWAEDIERRKKEEEDDNIK